MRKILLITLGGTISCVQTKKGLLPKLKAKELLKFITPNSSVNIDNLDFLKRTVVFPEDWILLSKKIFSVFDRYDGFVVTLGTDTLAFVSSALSLMLGNLSKPVVLTGSMKPMQLKGSDGRRNLKDAIRIATEEDTGGVFVVFNGNIFDGGVVSKVRCDEKNAFESINSQPLGFISGNRVNWRNKPLRRKGKLRLRTNLDTGVITIKLTPQINEDFFKLLSSYHGILLEGYGDGNVPSNLVPPILALARKRIVVLSSQCPYGEVRHQYQGGSALVRNGVFSSRNMTKEMACVKLMWALGQSKNKGSVRKLMGYK